MKTHLSIPSIIKIKYESYPHFVNNLYNQLYYKFFSIFQLFNYVGETIYDRTLSNINKANIFFC